jgi:hypothetical protein
VNDLRNLVPTPAIACARVKLEAPWVRLSLKTVINTLRQAGVPIQEEGKISWGEDMPTWSDARSILQSACGCSGQVAAGTFECCWQCGQFRCNEAQNEHAKPCRQCHRQGDRICRGCNTTVHFQGECKWNKGISNVYRQKADERRWLCPTCLWKWAQQTKECPRRPAVRVTNEELLRHLALSAERCMVAAGSARQEEEEDANPSRRFDRWLSRYLTSRHRRDSDSIPVKEIQTACVASMAEEREHIVRERVRRAIEDRCRNGLLVTMRTQGELCVRRAA